MENPIFFINFSKKALYSTITEGLLKEIRYTPGDTIFDVNLQFSLLSYIFNAKYLKIIFSYKNK